MKLFASRLLLRCTTFEAGRERLFSTRMNAKAAKVSWQEFESMRYLWTPLCENSA